MQIRNAALLEARGELVLGKAGAAGGGDRAHIDQELHAGLFEFVEHRLGGRLFIADGEQLFGFCHFKSGYFTRSISSIAPAGARTLPSWIT